jgi:hypothetical protein
MPKNIYEPKQVKTTYDLENMEQIYTMHGLDAHHNVYAGLKLIFHRLTMVEVGNLIRSKRIYMYRYLIFSYKNGYVDSGVILYVLF